MHIPGLFPLQAWMDRIQGHISRGEDNKARFSALLLPVFEAMGCISMLGRICFRSAREREEGAFSLLKTAGKAALLALNILYAPYYGLRNPRGNLDYHRLAGLIIPPQARDVPLLPEPQLFKEPFIKKDFEENPSNQPFDDSQDPSGGSSSSQQHSDSPTFASPEFIYSNPSSNLTPVPQEDSIVEFSPKEEQQREEKLQSPISSTPKNLETETASKNLFPIKTSPRSSVIDFPIDESMDLFFPPSNEKESEFSDKIPQETPDVEKVQAETTPLIPSPIKGLSPRDSLFGVETPDVITPVDEKKNSDEKESELSESESGPLAKSPKSPKSASPLGFAAPSPAKIITVTPIKPVTPSSRKTPGSGIQNRLAQLQQSTSSPQKLNAREEIEQERNRQLQLHQTPPRVTKTPDQTPELPSIFTPSLETIVLMPPTPQQLPAQAFVDFTPHSSQLKVETDVHSRESSEEKLKDSFLSNENILEDSSSLTNPEDSHSDPEPSDSDFTHLFSPDSPKQVLGEVEAESDHEDKMVVTTSPEDSQSVNSNDHTLLAEEPSLDPLPRQTRSPTSVKLTTTYLDLGPVKSKAIDFEFSTPEKQSSKSTNQEFAWLTGRHIDFNKPFELKVDEKKGSLIFKDSKKMSIDSKLIAFLQKKSEKNAFDEFLFAPLYALRNNLQQMLKSNLIQDKSSTLASIEKRLNELIDRWWTKEDYRKQKLSGNCRLLIQYVIARHHLDSDERSDGRMQERLMRQSNSPQTSKNLEMFRFHDKKFAQLSIYDYYAVLKTFLMNFPPEQKAIFAGCQQSNSKESLIQAIKAIPAPADRALAIDLVSLLWTTLYKVWAPEDGLNLDELNDDNREKFYKTTNSMLIGGNAIALLLCPSQVTSIKMGSQSIETKTPIHTHLIELILDYPIHFEELRKSIVS